MKTPLNKHKALQQEMKLLAEEKEAEEEDNKYLGYCLDCYYDEQSSFQYSRYYDNKTDNYILTDWEIRSRILTVGIEINKDEEKLAIETIHNSNLSLEETINMLLLLR